MAGYRLTLRAQRGLRDIIEYVEHEFGVRVAEDVLDRLSKALESIAEHPRIGHTREDITSDAGIRFWSVSPSLIAYRSRADGVEVLLVERGERDWIRLMRGVD